MKDKALSGELSCMQTDPVIFMARKPHAFVMVVIQTHRLIDKSRF